MQTTSYVDWDTLGALVRCLSPDELLDTLRVSYKDPLELRDIVLNAIDDFHSAPATSQIDATASGIMAELEDLSANRRPSAFVCLRRLLPMLSAKVAEEVRNFLLSSRFAGGRRTGQRALTRANARHYLKQIEHSAYHHRDSFGAKTIVRFLPPDYVSANLARLDGLLKDDYWRARLYLTAARA